MTLRAKVPLGDLLWEEDGVWGRLQATGVQRCLPQEGLCLHSPTVLGPEGAAFPWGGGSLFSSAKMGTTEFYGFFTGGGHWL